MITKQFAVACVKLLMNIKTILQVYILIITHGNATQFHCMLTVYSLNRLKLQCTIPDGYHLDDHCTDNSNKSRM